MPEDIAMRVAAEAFVPFRNGVVMVDQDGRMTTDDR
jgi:hypothetical protein